MPTKYYVTAGPNLPAQLLAWLERLPERICECGWSKQAFRLHAHYVPLLSLLHWHMLRLSTLMLPTQGEKWLHAAA